jgi:hypothetical protein
VVSATTVPAASTAAPEESARVSAPARPNAPSVAASPPRSSSPSSSVATVAPPAPSERPASGLNQEVAALDRARSALAAGNGTDGLRRLDDYERDFPRGLLAQEALVLRIDTLMRLGRTSEAKALAARFVATYPQSPYAARMRALSER